jgi:hypothetical protein
MKAPAVAFSKVDLPEPLVPSTIRNAAAGTVKQTSQSARISFCVPGLNVLDMWSICSIYVGRSNETGSAEPDPSGKVGHNERGEDEHRGDELKVIGI